MTNTNESDILIIGAGPVGLTLALDLAYRGVRSTVVERRRRGVLPEVKCNHTSARSMEIFCRLGLADTLRAAGLPPDFPHSVTYRTRTTGRELCEIKIPSSAERFSCQDGADCGWPTSEPPHRINQIYLEPILFAAADAHPLIDIRSPLEFEDFTQDADGVTAHFTDLRADTDMTIRARYLIGCDGARSRVRKQIGTRLEGDVVIQRTQSTFIRAPGLIAAMKERPTWGMFSLNPDRVGNVYAIDGKETWLIHNYLKEDEESFESVDRDRCIRQILGVDDNFEYTVISNEDWYGRRMVAGRFRDRRVFICGDASHIWVPYAGYGMNAGIADATNLSWKLAAWANGWASADILDSYESERKPITEQVSYFVMDHSAKMANQRLSVPDNIEAEDAAGEAARKALGQAAYELNVNQYAAAGLNFGYFYDHSPIIAYDGAAHPGYTMSTFTSSTVPGCRTPHFPLPDGRSLYDALGPEYSLMRLDPTVDVQPLLAAAHELGMPLTLLDVDPDDVPADAGYAAPLVLSRPDWHVAWRGDRCPADPRALLQKLTAQQQH